MVITAYKGFAEQQPGKQFDVDPLAGYSTIGSFGSGIYFGNLECAKEFAATNSNGGQLFESVINPVNPLSIDTSDNLIDEFDIDTYALPLIAHLYQTSLTQAAKLFTRLAVNDYLLGNDINQLAKSLGHDAILITYNGNAKVFELVVLCPSIIAHTKLIG